MYIQPPRGVDRPDAPASRWRRARARLLRPMVVVSLLVHLVLLGLLLVIPPTPPSLPSAPESSFEIVLNGGAPKPVSPGHDATPPAAKPGTEAPQPAPEPLPSPIAPASEPTPSTVPSPPPAAEPSPESPAPAPPSALAPATTPAPSSAPRVELPTPELPEPVPVPEVPSPLPTPPAQPRPRQYARPAPPRPSQRNPSGFPAPQDWSFNGGLVSHPAQQGAAGRAEMAGPVAPAPRITGAELGRDWLAAYSAWVERHLYYPEQAAVNGEDGTAEVIINIDRYGKVLTVELVTRSGSQWLDLETTGMFRGAHVPAFPIGTKEDTATVDQTIHYILRR